MVTISHFARVVTVVRQFLACAANQRIIYSQIKVGEKSYGCLKGWPFHEGHSFFNVSFTGMCPRKRKLYNRLFPSTLKRGKFTFRVLLRDESSSCELPSPGISINVKRKRRRRKGRNERYAQCVSADYSIQNRARNKILRLKFTASNSLFIGHSSFRFVNPSLPHNAPT